MKFNTLYTDPPWSFKDQLDPSRRKPYSSLTPDQIQALDVKPLVADEAHLYMWTPVSYLWRTPAVMTGWGFEYRTLIPWIKLTSTEQLIHFGMGRYFRNCWEACMFGVRANAKLLTKNERNILVAPRQQLHSAKPPEMYDFIERNSPGPYLELFAREPREGWTSVGYEIDGLDIRESLGGLRKWFK